MIIRIEVVDLAVNLLFPLHCVCIAAKVVRLVADGLEGVRCVCLVIIEIAQAFGVANEILREAVVLDDTVDNGLGNLEAIRVALEVGGIARVRDEEVLNKDGGDVVPAAVAQKTQVVGITTVGVFALCARTVVPGIHTRMRCEPDRPLGIEDRVCEAHAFRMQRIAIRAVVLRDDLDAMRRRRTRISMHTDEDVGAVFHSKIYTRQEVRLGNRRERRIRRPRHVNNNVRKPLQQLLDVLGNTQVERMLLEIVAHGARIKTAMTSVDNDDEGVNARSRCTRRKPLHHGLELRGDTLCNRSSSRLCRGGRICLLFGRGR